MEELLKELPNHVVMNGNYLSVIDDIGIIIDGEGGVNWDQWHR